MNTKITFPELINAISIATNTTKRVSETFLKEFFAVITEALISGENVKIKRIGLFKLTSVDARKSINVNTGEEIEIPAHNRLVFTPDKELAEAVNMPFSSFETIELDDVISDSDLEKLNDTGSVATENTESENLEEEKINSNSSEESVQDDVPDLAEQSTEEQVINVNSGDSLSDIKIDEEPEIDNDSNVDETELPAVETVEEEEEPKLEIDSVEQEPEQIEEATEELIEITSDTETEKNIEMTSMNDHQEDTERPCDISENTTPTIKCSFGKGFFWGFVCSLFTSFGIFFIVAQFNGFPIIINSSYNDTIENKTSNIVVKPVELIDTTSTTPKAKEITTVKETVQLDTITKSQYLTTLSRKYYGDYNFWVYIYAENSDILKNPNKIRPGTVVVIPPAAKYGIDKTDKNSLNDARKRAAEIFKKYE